MGGLRLRETGGDDRGSVGSVLGRMCGKDGSHLTTNDQGVNLTEKKANHSGKCPP